MVRIPELTPEIAKKIISSIRAGGYPHVAAQACAVPMAVFEDWLQRGGAANASEPYASFARDVLEATGQARLRAEIATYQQGPTVWLKHGPGRESESSPGWSAPVKAMGAVSASGNPLADPRLLEMFRGVLTVLDPQSTVYRAVVDKLVKDGLPLFSP